MNAPSRSASAKQPQLPLRLLWLGDKAQEREHHKSSSSDHDSSIDSTNQRSKMPYRAASLRPDDSKKSVYWFTVDEHCSKKSGGVTEEPLHDTESSTTTPNTVALELELAPPALQDGKDVTPSSLMTRVPAASTAWAWGGLQLVSTAPSMQVYYLPATPKAGTTNPGTADSPSSDDATSPGAPPVPPYQYLTTLRGIPQTVETSSEQTTSTASKDATTPSPTWYKVLCAVPGGPRPVHRVRLVPASSSPNVDSTQDTFQMHWLRLTARVVAAPKGAAPKVSGTSPAAAALLGQSSGLFTPNPAQSSGLFTPSPAQLAQPKTTQSSHPQNASTSLLFQQMLASSALGNGGAPIRDTAPSAASAATTTASSNLQQQLLVQQLLGAMSPQQQQFTSSSQLSQSVSSMLPLMGAGGTADPAASLFPPHPTATAPSVPTSTYPPLTTDDLGAAMAGLTFSLRSLEDNLRQHVDQQLQAMERRLQTRMQQQHQQLLQYQQFQTQQLIMAMQQQQQAVSRQQPTDNPHANAGSNQSANHLDTNDMVAKHSRSANRNNLQPTTAQTIGVGIEMDTNHSGRHCDDAELSSDPERVTNYANDMNPPKSNGPTDDNHTHGVNSYSQDATNDNPLEIPCDSQQPPFPNSQMDTTQSIRQPMQLTGDDVIQLSSVSVDRTTNHEDNKVPPMWLQYAANIPTMTKTVPST